MNNILGNLNPVVKNLLILNVIMFLVKLSFQHFNDIDLDVLLGGYVFGSPFFKPFQIVTHFFMHADFYHILFNMFGVVIFGNILEKVWGAKKFFIFYFACGIGAFILYQLVGYIELIPLKNALINNGVDLTTFDGLISDLSDTGYSTTGFENLNNYLNRIGYHGVEAQQYFSMVQIPMIGASGALFGVLVAFAYLFPNTELYLMFIPVPIKAKYLVLGYLALEIYQSIQRNPGDNVAHFAHVSGALVGFIIVLFWQKSKKNFY